MHGHARNVDGVYLALAKSELLGVVWGLSVGLFDAYAGQISTSGTVRDDSVKQTLAGLYGSTEIG